MKKVLACFIFVGLLMSSPLAYAQTMKFAWFDMDRVFNESKRWAKERDAFLKRGTELDKTLQRKKTELDAIRESIEKKGGMLNAEARREKEKEYQQKAKEFERIREDAKMELQQMSKESSTRGNLILVSVIKKLGEEGKYTLILEKGVIAYVTKDLDITDQVLKAFDAAKE